MELIAYSGGFQIYLWLRRRAAGAKSEISNFKFQIQRPPSVPFEQNMWLIIGAIFGALIGSKLLAWLESPSEYFPHLRDPLLRFRNPLLILSHAINAVVVGRIHHLHNDGEHIELESIEFEED